MAKPGLMLYRFSREALDALWRERGAVEEILDFDAYCSECLESTVGADVADVVVERLQTSGLDYRHHTRAERTALDVVLFSLFSPDRTETLWPSLDADYVDVDPPFAALDALRECGAKRGDEGLLAALLDGRRLGSDQVPDGVGYTVLSPDESRALARQLRVLAPEAGLAKKDVRLVEEKLVPALEELAGAGHWLFACGQSQR